MSGLQVVNLSKKYGSFYAVKNINFQVNSGEIFGFLGPNGAGKTTTINMITGLLQPNSGHVILDDQKFYDDPLRAKKIVGYAPDSPVLYEKLRLSEFIDFIISIYDLDAEKAWKRGGELLELFDLNKEVDSLLGSFSRGMKQKAALTTALITDPQILVLDEPTNGLDPLSVRRLKDLLVREAERGKAILMSTHILEIAEKMSHRIGIIQSGQLVASGTIDELRELKTESTAPHGETTESAEDLENLFLQLTGGDGHDYLE